MVIAGHFNHADVKCPLVWKRWVTTFKVIDVHPSLATYLHAGGTSALDRCLVPEDWVSTARRNPEIRTLHTSQTNGHKILKLSVRARPTVLNNPRDVKHETIPTGVFMPGKDGHATKDNRSLNRLVRLHHRTHHDLFDGLPCPNRFRVGSQEGMDLPNQRDPLSLPSLAINDSPNVVLEQNYTHQNHNAARGLHSTRNEGSDSIPCGTDVGGLSSNLDDTTAISQAFIDRHKPFMSKMPWENSIMKPIFGDPPTLQSTGVPSSWSVEMAQPLPAGFRWNLSVKLRKLGTLHSWMSAGEIKGALSLERCHHRIQRTKFWMDRMAALKSDERTLKSKMHKDVKHVLADKNILLWEEMLAAINYEDMGVVDEFMCGTSLVGAAPATGLWPAKFTPATMSVGELHDTARRERAQAIDMDASMVQTVWEQTLAEVQARFLIGPIELDDVPAHIPLSKRFGVKQGAKTRCVDEFTRSGINSCAQLSKSPKPHTVDIIASLGLSLVRHSPAGASWKVRAYDLSGAYRQCAVHPDSLQFSYILVAVPGENRSVAFQMRALPFGSVRSVHALLRVAQSLWAIATSEFLVPWTSYFDDFVTFADSNEQVSVTVLVLSASC